jgi:hypothetical protein
MQPEGHFTPYRFLLGGSGPGFIDNLLSSDVQGIITCITGVIIPATSAASTVVSVAGTGVASNGVFGFPPGDPVPLIFQNLWIPIYGGEVVRADFNGGAGDAFTISVAGILYSVNVAT